MPGIKAAQMLFAKATVDGLRVTGFLENPALVLVTCKSATGETRVIPLDCDHRGYFTESVAVKGFQVMDVVGIPILKTRRTLYVSRPVKNGQELADFFKAQGVETVAPDDMHVTLAYSKRRIDWEAVGGEDEDLAEIDPSFRRSVIPLGDQGAVVLRVESPVLRARWDHFLAKGASWDHSSFRPHITISYSPEVDPSRLVPFAGRIVLGPEKFAEINDDWAPTQKADRKSPPEGYPEDRSQYAVPEEYEFPIDEKHIHAAISYFHKHHFKDEAQKKRAAKRILSAARKHGVEVSEDSDVARAAHGG